MRIGVLGAGNIGGRLGALWSERGHEVTFGVRDVEDQRVRILLNSIGPKARACNVSEASAFGDVVVLAVHWPAVQEVLSATNGLSGKVLVDCTNRMGPAGGGGLPSGAEEIARMVPGAKVVKAFNTLGAEHLTNLRFGDESASTFICGNDPAARAVVRGLGEDIGFDVVDAGPLSNAGLIESLAKLWVQLARQQGGRAIAFKLLRR